MTTKTDPQTGEVFYPKRSNQVFASRKNQTAFNNAKAKSYRDKLVPINNELRKNWLILSKILEGRESAIISKDYLLGAGYNLSYYNNYSSFNNNPYYGIYEFGIRPLNNPNYEIVKFKNHE